MGNPGLVYIVLVESEGFMSNPGLAYIVLVESERFVGNPGLAYIVLVESEWFMGNPGVSYIVLVESEGFVGNCLLSPRNQNDNEKHVERKSFYIFNNNSVFQKSNTTIISYV